MSYLYAPCALFAFKKGVVFCFGAFTYLYLEGLVQAMYKMTRKQKHIIRPVQEEIEMGDDYHKKQSVKNLDVVFPWDSDSGVSQFNQKVGSIQKLSPHKRKGQETPEPPQPFLRGPFQVMFVRCSFQNHFRKTHMLKENNII